MSFFFCLPLRCPPSMVPLMRVNGQTRPVAPLSCYLFLVAHKLHTNCWVLHFNCRFKVVFLGTYSPMPGFSSLNRMHSSHMYRSMGSTKDVANLMLMCHILSPVAVAILMQMSFACNCHLRCIVVESLEEYSYCGNFWFLLSTALIFLVISHPTYISTSKKLSACNRAKSGEGSYLAWSYSHPLALLLCK